jgi:homoserine O-acetyltransferase
MRRAVFLLVCVVAASAQSGQQFADIGDLKLENGSIISHCRIGYRTFGTPDSAKSNAVLFPTWFTGRSEDLAGYIGPGKMVDSSAFFVITVDALGNGVSTSPSNGAASFPEFTIRDMVNSQHLLLTRHLGLKHLRAVVGISMGGMQTFEWMAAYPDFFDRAVPIIGSPKLTTADLLLWQAELSAIETVQRCKCDPRAAMQAVNAIHQFALYTPEYYAQRPASEFAKIKETLGPGQMAPADWASQLRAMMSHDIGRANGGSLEQAALRVKAKTLVVIARRDHMVNPRPAMQFANRIRARILELTGDCGHMATSCEGATMTPLVRALLSE